MTTARALQPFVDVNLLSSFDVSVAVQLADRVQEDDPSVVLALALAIRAPMQGHVFVDLGTVSVEATVPADRGMDLAPTLPTERAEWVERVGACALVARDGVSGHRPFQLDHGRIYTDRSWTHQVRVADRLRQRMTAPCRPLCQPATVRAALGALFPNSTSGVVDRQALAAVTSLLRPLTVITGGPGTGKTWTVRNLLAIAMLDVPDGAPPLRVALAAPTGKAAIRMQDALHNGIDSSLVPALSAAVGTAVAERTGAAIQSLQPTTLHRLLGWQPHNPTRFRHCRDNPLPVDLVIVDETSMVDLAMMDKLTDALLPTTRIVVVGDPHQLASVAAGSVLADVTAPAASAGLRRSSGMVALLRTTAGMDLPALSSPDGSPSLVDSIVPLTVNRRFGLDSGIGRFAAAVIAEPFDVHVAMRAFETDGSDLERVAPGAALEPELIDKLAARHRTVVDILHAGPVRGESSKQCFARAIDAFDAFRILCAHHRGPFGVAEINRVLSARLRPSGVGSDAYWIGRPILITENDYSTGRFNGDIGLVVALAGQLSVAFRAPQHDAGIDCVPIGRLPAHTNCFALTIHRSQGSQWSEVMVVLPTETSPILTRELIYTGVTRARTKAMVIGSDAVLEHALSTPIRRASGLREQLWGAQASQCAW